MTKARDMMDASGKPRPAEEMKLDLAKGEGKMDLEAALGEIAPSMPKDIADPMQVLALRGAQQRASMIGSLAGAYILATSLDPTDAELVQSSKEDGSLSLRFRPREPQSELYVVMANDGESTFPVRILAEGVQDEATMTAKLDCMEAQINTSGDRTVALMAVKVPLEGFGEDLKR